jgi:hypothetical protein
MVSAAAATAVALSAAIPAAAAPTGDAAGVRYRVKALYEQAESATERYDAAQERQARLRAQVEGLRDQVARGKDEVNRMRQGLAAVAGAQYRAGAVDPSLALLLSPDPGSYLDRAATLDRIGSRRADELRRLRDAERSLRERSSQAGKRLAELDRTRRALADQKQALRGRLAQAQRLLDSLPPDEQLAAGIGRDGLPVVGKPELPLTGEASSRAATALAAARSALGTPYAWGGTGPGGFDCSGLTYWAYQHAGVALPRTSQEQMRAGRRVPLAQARPGDLVVYRDDASHVAMYVGNGWVIHAPYPGARVRYDRVDMMPLAGVTRV